MRERRESEQEVRYQMEGFNGRHKRRMPEDTWRRRRNIDIGQWGPPQSLSFSRHGFHAGGLCFDISRPLRNLFLQEISR